MILSLVLSMLFSSPVLFGITVFEAAYLGDVKFIESYIKGNGDVNAVNPQGPHKLNIVMNAAIGGHADVMKLLIGARADLNGKDSDGKTAVMLAVNSGFADIVKMLVNAKADVNVKEKNEKTALMLAVIAGKPDIVKLLIAAGAEVNAKEKSGKTALKFAKNNKNKELTDILMKAGGEE
jgi:ankyrin repeat protein